MSDFDYPPPTPPASKGRRKWPWITGAVVSGLLIIGVVDPTGSRDTAAQEAAVAAASATTTSTSKAAIATTSPVAPSSAATTPESMLAPVPAALAVENADGANAALTLLATLPIKGRAPKTGYDREMFGQAWTDDVTVEGGRNGCDTRNDILRRDLTAITVKPGSNGCAVQTGTLADTYTATTISFVRGTDTSSAVQIDHMVALSNAWQTGAQQLDPATRANLANDPRNLQAVDGPANQQKSDGDAATWLPSNTAYRCTYVARQVEVKAAYGLWVTQPEHDAITRVLGDCGGAVPVAAPAPVAEPIAPAPAPAPVAPAPVAPAPAPIAPAPAPAPVAPAPLVEAPAPSSVYYQNCSAVRAAGAAPIRAGQPGYSSKLDRDGDGIACE
ncbi:DUF1524 domain-containing protein [Rhodococcus sp. PAMC28707]|uniref:GmrSD restriction endonuclease domain-containing protein n=1 Tax=unclassified Rhodococcus (in: high G+C Gram-positive bacteria) TaxID=192944 RepID=UPI00109D8FBF|nr:MULTISPECIES: DUF1524 domain-containing protein [unclassified Rhodococcus (in: high G+C Gram-positive bacteria)]QCB51792.1 DUF1524 domain-containing protein [Rhodococcus sp. PAMC28705]QCB60040.1 DUF1524 domain-containing protein [Rhodococcus sp. PAMC28707]